MTKETAAPLFTHDNISETIELICPECCDEGLHQSRTDVYVRNWEDAESGIHMTVKGENDAGVWINFSMDGNPSPRRQGLTIKFWCEMCKTPSWLNIFQHKGHTLLSMDYEPRKDK